MNTGDQFILFARYPVPGQAKTRLIPALGPEGAARLHRRLTERAVGVARAAGASRAPASRSASPVPRGGIFAPGSGVISRTMLSRPVISGSACERLSHPRFAPARSGWWPSAQTCPTCRPRILLDACAGLREHDVVLGPAADGGYYLIGMKRDRPGLFAGVDWGTGRVLAQTRAAIERQGLSVLELPTLSDVDVQYIRRRCGNILRIMDGRVLDLDEIATSFATPACAAATANTFPSARS